jgi:hypothetical protein
MAAFPDRISASRPAPARSIADVLAAARRKPSCRCQQVPKQRRQAKNRSINRQFVDANRERRSTAAGRLPYASRIHKW